MNSQDEGDARFVICVDNAEFPASLALHTVYRVAPMRTIDKAFAYITRADQLLVFEHVDVPRAGVQVPAGTVKAGEPPASGRRAP